MKYKEIAAGLLLIFGHAFACAQIITPTMEEKAAKIVSQMTLDEKIAYLSGQTSFSLRAIPRLGIPEMRLADGPQGIRNHSPQSTLFPSGILTASTWNRGLAYRLGRALGQDAKARGVNILLGPGVNIYRSPLCGRNYEYMGEDPFLAGETAKEYIMGVQSEGVIATVKHFAANNQEWNRHHASSDVDERTLQEIYFPAFKKAVMEAKVGAVMDSYNLLNGVHSTENSWLNIDVLRNSWGFKGILMSDWTSVYSAVGAANGGLDLEMPKGRYMNAENLLPALKNGRVTEATIDMKVQHLLQTFMAYGMLDKAQQDKNIPLDNPYSRETALNLAREGVVLLKNEKGMLPLKGKTAVLGPNANKIPTGGGSGFVTPFSPVSLCQALAKERKSTVILSDDILYNDINGQLFTDSTFSQRGYKAEYFKNQEFKDAPAIGSIDPRVDFDWGDNAPKEGFPVDHFSVRWNACYKADEDGILKISLEGDDGYRIFINGEKITGDWGNHSISKREVDYQVKAGKTYHFLIEYFDNISSAKITFGISKFNEKMLIRELKKVDNVVFCAGFDSNIEGEGFDRPFGLPSYQEMLIRKVSELNPNLTVVVNAGGGIDFTSWQHNAKAILMAWYPGEEGGTALSDILTGKISPSGKLPVSIEKRWEDNPCFNSYYDNLSGSEYKRIDYKEGVFVGYRGYDQSGIKPLYPFGFGMSYSTFEYSNLTTENMGDHKVKVSFDVKNTGKMAASEIAQLYVHPTHSPVPRPQKELKGYEKVFLKKGETKRIIVVLAEDAFSYYDMDHHQFVPEKEPVEIWIGSSSENILLKKSVNL